MTLATISAKSRVMHFHVITLFPEMIQAATGYGVVGQAIKAGKLNVSAYDPRTWTTDVHRAVDDRPFGGGDGMLMLPDVLDKALENVKQNLKSSNARRIYLSARGKPLTDALARELKQTDELVLLCGRYGGVDQRFIEANSFEEVSIGDYVLSGGEMAALVLIDSVGRLLPGVLGNAQSPEDESFAKGWLEHPQFTRPREWNAMPTPEVLFSGNHAKIKAWRESLSLLTTAQVRPDLLDANPPTAKQVKVALEVLAQLSVGDLASCGIKDSHLVADRLKGFQ